MSAQSEYEAAYYVLLRAREEGEALATWMRMLEDERVRVKAFLDETLDHPTKELPFKLAKVLDGTNKPLVDALKGRLSIIDSELRRLPDTIKGQADFIEACELEADVLRP